MNLVIEIIAYLCEFIMQMLCIHAFLGRKIKIDVKIIVTGIAFITILLITMHIPVSRMFTLISYVIIFVYINEKFKLKTIDNALLIVFNILISGSVQVICIFPVNFWASIISSDHIMVLIIEILSLALMKLLVHVVKFNKLYSKAIEWDDTIIKMLFIVFFLFLYLYVRYKVKEEMEILSYFISALMICITIRMALSWRKDRYEIKQKSLELHMHQLYGKTVEAMIDNIRIRQHDFKNQLAAIYGMHLTANSLDELVENQRKYCDYLMNESKYDSILTRCEDKILAGFLYTKLVECEQKRIEVDFKILLKNSKCRFATYELIEVVGILIDNALEYEMDNDKDRKIYLELKDNENEIKLICRNIADYIKIEEINKFFKKGYSTKGKNRGLGLFDVKRILKDRGEIVVTNRLIDDKNWIEFFVEIYR